MLDDFFVYLLRSIFYSLDLCGSSVLWYNVAVCHITSQIIFVLQLTGENISTALNKEIYHYNVHTSLFDIVLAALCRFTVLLLFYALLYINHWIIISVCTLLLCLFAKIYWNYNVLDQYNVHLCILNWKSLCVWRKYHDTILNHI